MRINKYIAQATGLSRRSADKAILDQRVKVDDKVATLGQEISNNQKIALDNKPVFLSQENVTVIMLNKPAGYVCSRSGQGSNTIYNLLPRKYWHLKPVGRLDKNSTGLILLTNDGDLANQLTHPKYEKFKTYHIKLSTALSVNHYQAINNRGVQLKDGLSILKLRQEDDSKLNWEVIMKEGRNRQIRRTFESLGYIVKQLHRSQFGNYSLGTLGSGKYIISK